VVQAKVKFIEGQRLEEMQKNSSKQSADVQQKTKTMLKLTLIHYWVIDLNNYTWLMSLQACTGAARPATVHLVRYM